MGVAEAVRRTSEGATGNNITSIHITHSSNRDGSRCREVMSQPEEILAPLPRLTGTLRAGQSWDILTVVPLTTSWSSRVDENPERGSMGGACRCVRECVIHVISKEN
eukprot:Blabericola_migrator_1__4250@NODE_22_length_22262_cov_139_742014_g19_i0_p18_GENE_NODE_22_length_22262_cov_139_742014_g19_i0NODE_22_length_22262_cov_139_742014_g19_i0_p18_ORF_typecomplete_len107_score4_72_NODE_22_length_22262_cov_139_742014_g19_i0658978